MIEGGRIAPDFALASRNDEIEFETFGAVPHFYSRGYGHTPAHKKGGGPAYLSRQPTRRPTLARSFSGALVEPKRRGTGPLQPPPEFGSDAKGTWGSQGSHLLGLSAH